MLQLLVEIGAKPIKLLGVAKVLGIDGFVELRREDPIVSTRNDRIGLWRAPCARRLFAVARLRSSGVSPGGPHSISP